MQQFDSTNENPLWEDISLFIVRDKFIFSCPVHDDMMALSEEGFYPNLDGPYRDVDHLPSMPVLALKSLDLQIRTIRSLIMHGNKFQTKAENVRQAVELVKDHPKLFDLVSESNVNEDWFDADKGIELAIRSIVSNAGSYCGYHFAQDAAVKLIETIRGGNFTTPFDFYYISTTEM